MTQNLLHAIREASREKDLEIDFIIHALEEAIATAARKFYHLEDKVVAVHDAEKDEIRAKEAIYFAFPFAAQSPAMEYQIQNGWCRPNEDQMPGACREWFTPQNLVHVRDGSAEVEVDAADPVARLRQGDRRRLAHAARGAQDERPALAGVGHRSLRGSGRHPGRALGRIGRIGRRRI